MASIINNKLEPARVRGGGPDKTNKGQMMLNTSFLHSISIFSNPMSLHFRLHFPFFFFFFPFLPSFLPKPPSLFSNTCPRNCPTFIKTAAIAHVGRNLDAPGDFLAHGQ